MAAGRMEQDPVVEVKIEIDVAENSPQSCCMTEKDPHGADSVFRSRALAVSHEEGILQAQEPNSTSSSPVSASSLLPPSPPPPASCLLGSPSPPPPQPTSPTTPSSQLPPLSLLPPSVATLTRDPPHPSTPQEEQGMGFYSMPTEETTPRKRKAKPEAWKKNTRKRLKLQGKEYTTVRGTKARERKLQEVDCSNCKLKCTEKIKSEQRQVIFSTFYGLDAYDRQKDYICRHVDQKNTRTYLNDYKNPVPNRRQVVRTFFLTAEGERVQVCKQFFLATLDVGHGYVTHALQNSRGGAFVGEDKRGKHAPGNKTSGEAKARAKRHIESFPAVESQHSRQDKRRELLDTGLTINQMHTLYREECLEEGVSPVSNRLYREIFYNECNLAFHKPKREQCLIRCPYEEDKELTADREEQYEECQKRERESGEEREEDKRLAQQRNDTHAVAFDLHSVLTTSCSLVSQLRYKQGTRYKILYCPHCNKEITISVM